MERGGVLLARRGGLMSVSALRRRISSGHVPKAAAAAAAPGGAAAAAVRKRDPVPALSGTKLDPSESFMTGSNAFILEEMYKKYQRNPSKVDPSWVTFFDNIEHDVPPGEAVALSRQGRTKVSMIPNQMTAGHDLFQMAEDTVKLMALIRAYRHRGHLMAELDPLHIDETAVSVGGGPSFGGGGGGDLADIVPHNTKRELEPSHYGFTDADLDREFVVGAELPGPSVRKLRDIIRTLRRAYCGTIGVEYRHMLSKQEKDWIASQVETPFAVEASAEDKVQIMSDLMDTELFERFLSYKHATAKRFGLEGGESIVPGINAMMLYGSEVGVENVVIGMPHRGRLNVLASVVQKRLVQIFYEFTPHDDPDAQHYLGSGDVKYHLGTSNTVTLRNGHVVNFSLLANPSHLEAVDPIAVGKTRAKQFFTHDYERRKTMALILHGDASFAGQGVVAETLELSDLRDYTTGGSVHVIVNNQIGFTTDPRAARSSPYPTDVAKTVGIPIFHVNGDDVESVVRVCRMAMEYRQRFRKDVVVDVFCYRRHGHNELDQPMFTQPLMYKKIKDHPTPMQIFAKKLINQGVMTQNEITKMSDAKMAHLNDTYDKSKQWKPSNRDWLAQQWTGIKTEKDFSFVRRTGVPEKLLRSIGAAYTRVPAGFRIHALLKKILNERKTMIELGESIDWATAEALAVATLLHEGTAVRLSGQDCERGTFSQRHMVWHDQETGAKYSSLNNLGGEQARLQVANSNLSEMAVLGFEQGFSLDNPNSLVCWEAQFGDFANGAQVIIDTFIAAGERKWRRQSGIVLLLPHGYEGQGPEHSSARIERYLQLCDDDPDVLPKELDIEHSTQIQNSNMQIVNPSTPANYFHVLRRQIHRDFRKPLVAFTPKSLLRHPQCRSRLDEFTENMMFLRLIDDAQPGVATGKDVRRLCFCSGKVYFDLIRERALRKCSDVRFVRVEQLSPFPFDLVIDVLKQYPKADLKWVQEESKNMGAWTYVSPRFATALRSMKGEKRDVTYIGRAPSAAPATGNALQHQQELAAFMEETFA